MTYTYKYASIFICILAIVNIPLLLRMEVVFVTTYTLKEARETLGLTKNDLSKSSGISLAAIKAIENGGQYRTSNGVALALCEALGMEVSEIEWPRGRSDLGRPAKTGKTVVRRTMTITVTEETVTERHGLCPRCFIELPVVGSCASGSCAE